MSTQQFQQHSQAEVVLLNVTEPAFEGSCIHTWDVHEKSHAVARHQIEALTIAYLVGATSVTTLFKEGRADEMICEVALNVDTIIIATRGY